MADQVGAIFVPSGADELRDQFLRDLRLAAIDSGVDEPPTQPGTDWFLLATASANLGLISLANVAISDSDKSVLKATGSTLDETREGDGLPVVAASGSTGKIVPEILGSTTIVNGTQLLLPNGLRVRVVGTYINPLDGDEINVAAIDTGIATNWAAGTVVRFVSPPVNVSVEAKVSTGEPLTGGTDVEGDERKRDRILNSRRNKPAGGNWAHIRQIALEASGAVQDCYVYPALGGPSSAKVVPVKNFDPDNNDFSRAMSSAALQVIRSAIQSQVPTSQEIVVEASVDQPIDVTVKITIPDSALSGGNGQGWTDAAPWPSLAVADSNDVSITALGTDSSVITVDAQTTTAPVDGQTNIAWWSAVDRKFYRALVVLHSGSAGAWVLTLDRPLVGKNGAIPAVGDYICPSAQNLDGYGAEWVQICSELGPGENTSDSNRLPRAKRHPFVTDEDPSSLNANMLLRLIRKFIEITDLAVGVVTASSPTVPASVATAPNILVPQKLAFYPK